MLRYDVLTEPSGQVYRDLLALGLVKSKTASLVVRSTSESSSSLREFLALVNPHLREKRMVSQWPGTQLIGHEAELRQYIVTPSFVAALADAVDRLYAWQEPDFPEDLCLYRDDGSPWLASIAHENDAYLTLHDEELDEILKNVPGLRIKKGYLDS